MKVIVHRIRLNSGTSPETFEKWVKEKDYVTCPDLPSLKQFGVHRVSSDPKAAFHYFEIIQVTSMEAFEKDMQTPQFHKLVEAFEKMASVVDEISGDLVEPGFRR